TYDDQADAFRRLNAIVTNTSPTFAVKDFISGLYTKPVGDPTAVATDDYVPGTWSSSPNKQALYRGAIKVGCRSCHMSAVDSPRNLFNFVDLLNLNKSAGPSGLANVGRVEDFVCFGKVMPQAERTMKNFWASGARAYLVETLSNGTAAYGCSP